MLHRRQFLASSAHLLGAACSAPLLADTTQETPAPKTPPFHLRYAPHFGMFGAHAARLEDEIRFLAEEGFTALEDNGMRGRSREEQERIAAAMEKHHVAMGVFVVNDIDWSKPTLTTGSKDSIERFVANCRDSVETAKRVRAKWLTVVPGVVEQRLDAGIQTAHVVEALRRGAEIFEPHGLVMVLEPLNWRDHPGQFLRYAAQAFEICRAVNSPSCKILFDAYHQQVSEGNLIPNIERCWSEIAYFQIGDNPGRCEPGTGEVNWRNLFKYIHGRGFQGILGMEHGNSRPGKEGERAVIDAYREADRIG